MSTLSPTRFPFRAMAGENELQLHAATPEHAARAARAAINEVARIEAKYSRYRADSVVSRINAAAGIGAVPIDEETAALLEYAHACWRESGGLFDPTSGVLRRAWRFEEGRVPADGEIAPLLDLVGWSRVERDGASVRLPLPGMELDFGGFGKEYAVDRAGAVLRGMGIESALVNLGGDILVTGPAPGGASWRVGIRHPRRADDLVATIAVGSGAIATSGDYERYFVKDGVRYCHILDPRSGHPVQGLQSVTVLGETCLIAGSASTIAMLKGEREGLEWLQASGVRHLSVDARGRLHDATGAAGAAC
jgi:thiamine biosynthesis lipoprotein